MPRGALNHNWGNQERNIPNFRSGIPQERQRIINRARGIEEEIEETSDNNTNNFRLEYEPIANVINAMERGEVVSRGSSISTGWYYDQLRNYISSQPNIQSIPTYNHTHTLSADFAYDFVDLSSPPKPKYIKSYNYIPEYKLHKIEEDIDNQYFGMEIEIDNGGEDDNKAKQLIDYIGEDYIYIKHDGSLTKGFEIVTQPCTYNYHTSRIDYNGLFKLAVELGYKAHDTETCGLHIHVNKNYFGDNKTFQDLNISKLLFLFEKYWDKLVIFSRRSYQTINKWAKRYEMQDNESMFDVLYKAKSAESSYNGKYHSINLKHTNTVEFRIFKGTLKYETFIATLQLVKRLCETAKHLNLEEVQIITWNNIFKDCEPELKEYLLLKDLL